MLIYLVRFKVDLMFQALVLLSSMLYISVMAVIFFKIFRRNRFWVYFLSIEYFYFLGLGVAPLIIVLGIQESPKYAYAFESISPLTFLHIIFYSVGAFLGFSSVQLSNALSKKLVAYSIRLNIDPDKVFKVFIVTIFVAAALYFYVTGLEKSITGAAYSRAGNFEYFEGAEKFAFLKRFIIICTYLSIFIPYFLMLRSGLFRRLLLIMLSGIVAYIVTVSRHALLQAIVLPVFFIWVVSWRRSVTVNFTALLVSILAIFIFLYGKSFVSVFADYIFSNGVFEFQDPGANNFLDAFSHLLFSIDVGIKSFINGGFYFPRDVAVSIFGVVPSSFFTYVGASSFSYQLIPQDLSFSCINTLAIANDSECFLPPYFSGASAYAVPFLGGFLFSYVRFLIYSAVSKSWTLLIDRERYLPTVLFIFYCADQVMYFIPSTISLTVFILLFLAVLNRLKLLR